MSTTLPISRPRSTRRVPFLAAASGLIAAASITVTLALAGGGSDTAPSPSAIPTHAHPDRATIYQRNADAPQPSGATDGKRSAERFHHFR
jgi:hypothetical protein